MRRICVDVGGRRRVSRSAWRKAGARTSSRRSRWKILGGAGYAPGGAKPNIASPARPHETSVNSNREVVRVEKQAGAGPRHFRAIEEMARGAGPEGYTIQVGKCVHERDHGPSSSPGKFRSTYDPRCCAG